jgi:hypothetical protein
VRSLEVNSDIVTVSHGSVERSALFPSVRAPVLYLMTASEYTGFNGAVQS